MACNAFASTSSPLCFFCTCDCNDFMILMSSGFDLCAKVNRDDNLIHALGTDSSSKFSGIAARGRFFFRAEASIGQPFLGTEAAVGRREAPLQGAVAGAEGTQGPVAQGGGEGHQPGVRGQRARVCGSFGGPWAASDWHSVLLGFKSASALPARP